MRDTLISGHLKDGLDPHDRTQRSKLTSIILDIDKHLLKLMQIACKEDKLEQALDAARLLGQPQSLEAASKLAAFFHQRGLQERIELLKEARSGEPSLEKERRESKWGHLVDNRTLVDSAQEALAYSSRDAAFATRSTNTLSKPVELSGASKRSLGDGSALGQMPTRAAPAVQHIDSGLGTSSDPPEYDTTAAMEEDVQEEEEEELEDETQLVNSPDRETTAEPSPLPTRVAPPAPKTKAANPFAKQNKAAAPPPTSSNPFAKRANGVGKQSDLKRSDSFFERVEGTAAKITTKEKTKQSTLFGKAPPAATEKDKKTATGKKRKTPDDNDQPNGVASASGLAKFLHRPAPTSVPEEAHESTEEVMYCVIMRRKKLELMLRSTERIEP